MLTSHTAEWRYRALVISIAANSTIALSVWVFGYFTAWWFIPGAYPAFRLCNLFDAGCKGRYENAAWVLGWLGNTLLDWVGIWMVGAVLHARRQS